ncbi:Hypothetical predicted protein, partial [Olea europaea subsp. europaea]
MLLKIKLVSLLVGSETRWRNSRQLETREQEIWSWGTSGQLGHGEMVNSLHPKPVKAVEGLVISHASAGWSHSGFVSDPLGDQVYGFGSGKRGQL